MKVQKIKIINFKGIDEVQADLNGRHVYLLGPNASDKSSFIDAAWTSITGKNLPSEPIKKGKTTAEIEVELDDFIVKTKFKKNSRPQFSVTSKTSGEVKSPRNVLNELIGVIDFDPNEFFALSAKQQVEYYCEKAGIDVETLDKEYAQIYESRAFDNKELKRIKDAIEPYDKEYADKKIIVATDIFDQIQDKEEDNRYWADVNQEVQQMAADNKELKLQIERIQKQIDDNVANMSKRAEWLTQNPEKDLTKLREKADNVEEENNKIRHAKENADREEQLAEIESAADEQTEELNEILDKKKKLIGDSIAIKELEYNGEQFLYNDLPFEGAQINTADQIIAGLQIGLEMIGDVRIMKFEGSLIDKKNAKKIRAWAKKNDIQLFVEIVDRDAEDDKLQIIVDEE